MAKAVADSYVDNQGGFATDSINVTGFSHMHDDGTGGVSRVIQSRLANYINADNHERELHWEISLSGLLPIVVLAVETVFSTVAIAPHYG
jgi:hypothetical protein